MKIRGCLQCGPRDCTCPLPGPLTTKQDTVSQPPLTAICPTQLGGTWNNPMSFGSFRVIVEKLDGECLTSQKFMSPISAREYALGLMNKSPDDYAEVSIVETYSVCVNTKTNEPATFVQSGPEFVRTDQPRLEHRSSKKQDKPAT